MKNFKIFTLIILFSTVIKGFDESFSSELIEFPEYTTDKYIYNKSIKITTNDSWYTSLCGSYHEGIAYDKTLTHYLNNGITRYKIIIEINDKQVIITTHTWTTKNPSHLTLTNAALLTGTIATLLGIGYTMKIQMALTDPLHPDHLYWKKIQSRCQRFSYSDNQTAREYGRKVGSLIKSQIEGIFEGLDLNSSIISYDEQRQLIAAANKTSLKKFGLID